MEQLPKDPVMLLSVVNMNLRDYYDSLDAFCEAKEVDKTELLKKLNAAGYEYMEERNTFM